MLKAFEMRETMGMDRVKALFFMLLNMDMPMKEFIIDTANIHKFAAAINKKVEDCTKIHSYSLIGMRPLSPEKATRFYPALRTTINTWMATEPLQPGQLVRNIREEYLIS